MLKPYLLKVNIYQSASNIQPVKCCPFGGSNVSRAWPASPPHSRDDVVLQDSANVACESARGSEKPSKQLSCVYMQLSCVYITHTSTNTSSIATKHKTPHSSVSCFGQCRMICLYAIPPLCAIPARTTVRQEKICTEAEAWAALVGSGSFRFPRY